MIAPLSLALALFCVPTLGRALVTRTALNRETSSHASCTDVYLPIHVQATNILFNNSLVNRLQPTEEELFSLFSLVNQNSANYTRAYVQGDYLLDRQYTVYGQLCHPVKAQEGREDTLEVLIHGTPFDHTYWSFSDEASQIPSYIEEAAKQGRSTFAYDRIGIGKSNIPDDAFEEIQLNSDVVVLEEIVKAARNSQGIGGRQWGKVAVQGHAYGALILLGAVQKEENLDLFDSIVLHGITNNVAGLSLFIASATFHIAKETLAKRKSYPPSYICFGSSVATFFSWYPLSGYPTVASDFRFKNQHPLAPGVPLTRSAPLSKTSKYSKPVMLVVGDKDYLFCLGDCYNEEKSGTSLAHDAADFWFPQATTKQVELLPGVGHVINEAFVAGRAFQAIFDFFNDASI